MNAIECKNNGKRLMAAVVALAMILCAVAVVAMPSDAQDGEQTTVAKPTVDIDTESITINVEETVAQDGLETLFTVGETKYYENNVLTVPAAGMIINLASGAQMGTDETPLDLKIKLDGDLKITGAGSVDLTNTKSQFAVEFTAAGDAIVIEKGADVSFNTNVTDSNVTGNKHLFANTAADALLQIDGATVNVSQDYGHSSWYIGTHMAYIDMSNKAVLNLKDSNSFQGVVLNATGSSITIDATMTGMVLMDGSVLDDSSITVTDAGNSGLMIKGAVELKNNASIDVKKANSATGQETYPGINVSNKDWSGNTIESSITMDETSSVKTTTIGVSSENNSNPITNGTFAITGGTFTGDFVTDVSDSTKTEYVVTGTTVGTSADTSSVFAGVTVTVPYSESTTTLYVANSGALDIKGPVDGSITGTGSVTASADADLSEVVGEGVTVTKSYNALADDAVAGEGWTFEKGVLTLDNYKGSSYFYGNISEVKLIGENVITVPADAITSFKAGSYFGAVRNNTDQTMKITGEAGSSLTIDMTETVTGSNLNINGIISGGALTVSADVTVNVAEGYTGIKAGFSDNKTVTIDGANVDADVTGTVTIKGNAMVTDLKDATLEENATVIVENLDMTSGNAPTNNGAAVIVTGTLKYSTDGPQLLVYNGVAQQVLGNQIYLAEGATYTGNVFAGQVDNPATGEIVNNVADANEKIKTGDVTFASLVPVDITGLVGNEDYSFIIGTVTGTVTEFTGTIVTNNLGAVVENTANPVSINGVSFDNVKGKGMDVVGDGKAVTITGTEISGTVEGAEGAKVVFKDVSAGAAGIAFSAGSVEISGDIILNGGASTDSIIVDAAAGADGEVITDLVLGNATITGKGTIAVKDLTIEGNVEIGADVIILVDDGCQFTVGKDGVLSGNGTVEVKQGGKIVVNGTIEETVTVNTPAEGVDITTAEEFITALEYYDTINVVAPITFNEENAKTPVNVNAKTIFLTDGEGDQAVSGAIAIEKGATVNFVDSIVNADGNVFTVAGGAVLGIDDSDIFCEVQVDEKATVNAIHNVTEITGSSTQLSSVGFGKELVFAVDFNLGSNSTIKVYGSITVGEGNTLNVVKGASITVMNYGKLAIDGTMTLNGALTVNENGEAAVAGTLTVAKGATITVVKGTTVTGDMDITGTLNMNGTMSGTYSNAGVVNINGAVTGTEICIFDGATVNIEKATGTMSVKSGTAYEPPVDENGDNAEKNNIVLEENSVTLTDVEGLVIAATENVVSKTENKVTTVTYTSVFDYSGAVTAGTITINKVTDAQGDNTITTTLGLTDATLVNQVTLDVAGAVTADADSAFNNTGTVNVTGSVAIAGATSEVAIIDGGVVNATYYDVTTPATQSAEGYVTKTYTALSTAVGVTNADEGTIYAIGKQTIDEGATVTVPAALKLDMVAGATIVVDGTLVFEDFENGFVPTDDENIKADVTIDEEPARTYTSLANAIAMGETEISLHQTVTLTSDLTIPAGITVSSEEFGVVVDAEKADKDVTLTVEGALELTGTATNNVLKLTDSSAKDESGAPEDVAALELVGDGYVYLNDDDAFTALESADKINGATYSKNIKETETAADNIVNVISTVEKAAADSVNAVGISGEAPEIAIVGKVDAVEDLTFTAAEDGSLTIDVRGEFDAMIVTLGQNVVIEANEKTTATVTDGTNAVALDGVEGAVIGNNPHTVDDVTAYRLEISGTSIVGDIAVSAGTVYIDTSVTLNGETVESVFVASTFGVDNGATLVIDKAGSLTISASGDNANILDVAGTLDVDGTVTVNGTMKVEGTVSVAGTLSTAGDVQVNGTIAVDAESETAAYKITGGLVIVGNKPTELGTSAGEGTISGAVYMTAGAILKAYPGSDLTQADVYTTSDKVKAGSTAFNINGQLYMTVYGVNVEISDILADEKYALVGLDTGLLYENNIVNPNNSGLYKIGNWFTSADMVPNTALTGYTDLVGTNTALYAKVGPVEVEIVVSVGTGLNMYIDGIAVDSGKRPITIGTHTVKFEVMAGYDGSKATITFAGLAIGTDGTFQVTVDSDGAILASSGAVPATQGGGQTTPVEPPVVNVNTGSDDMSLTDYLLIILVVLIVIMAIIVALRLMRS